GEGEAASEGGEGLAENRILLTLQLRQKARQTRTACLIDAAGSNQLVDERLDVLASQRRQGRHRNVEQVEIVWNMEANVAREVVADLEDANIEDHLRKVAGQLLQQRRARLQHRPRCAQFQRSTLSGADLLQIADVAQRCDHLGYFLRGRGSREGKRAQRHAVK